MLACASEAYAQLPVVPGASGFGMETRAAYACGVAPKIITVTNLNARGEGSFRQALEDPSPRVVIFEVSGTIDLDSQVIVWNPCLTIAGQTAPDPGITLMRHGIDITTHDVLIQHIRIRPGDLACNSAIEIWNFGSTPYNIVADHVSISWAQDESLAVGNTAFNVTFWKVLEGEGLFMAAGSEGCLGGGLSTGHGLFLYAGARNVFAAHSILSTNVTRNPYQQGDTSLVFANNLVYQWYGSGAFNASNYDSGGGMTGGPWYATVAGNVFKAGPQTNAYGDNWAFLYGIVGGYAPWGNQIYRSDNIIDSGGIWVGPEYSVLGYDPNIWWLPVSFPAGFWPAPASTVEAFTLANAGARPAQRDSVDARIVADIANRSGGFIRSQYQVGAWPWLAPNSRFLSTPSNPHADDDWDGYTNLEEWLHGFAAAVEGWGVSPPSGSTSPSTPPAVDGSGSSVPGGTSPGTGTGNGALDGWSIGPDQRILWNGVHVGGGYGYYITQLNGTVYVIGSDLNWWFWTGTYWALAGASPDDTWVDASWYVIDLSLNVWTIGASGETLLNGTHAAGGYGSQYLWHRGELYVFGGDWNWWKWIGHTWAWVGPNFPA
jgi:hypothetical protein